MEKTLMRSAFSVAALAFLTACGGGGGGSAPSAPFQVTQSVTCPNGSASSGSGADFAAAQKAAEDACPLVRVTSVTPADGAAGASSTAIITVATDGMLDVSTIAGANVKLKVGGVEVPAIIVTDGTKSFKLVPTGSLPLLVKHDFSYSVKDSLGRTVSGATSFTTEGVQQIYPADAVAITVANASSMGVATFSAKGAVVKIVPNLPNGTTLVTPAPATYWPLGVLNVSTVVDGKTTETTVTVVSEPVAALGTLLSLPVQIKSDGTVTLFVNLTSTPANIMLNCGLALTSAGTFLVRSNGEYAMQCQNGLTRAMFLASYSVGKNQLSNSVEAVPAGITWTYAIGCPTSVATSWATAVFVGDDAWNVRIKDSAGERILVAGEFSKNGTFKCLFK